jgi:DICT domain-containing protein
MTEWAAFVGALAVDLPAEPVAGVRGVALNEGEALRGEWDVVVLAPHFAGAMVARDLGDEDCSDMERRFDFCLTYERDLVVAAARSLMLRIAPR